METSWGWAGWVDSGGSRGLYLYILLFSFTDVLYCGKNVRKVYDILYHLVHFFRELPMVALLRESEASKGFHLL